MKFVVYRCTKTPDYFLITDEAHRDQMRGGMCPEEGDLELIGEYPELGESRVAFNESIAQSAIKKQGFYQIESKTFDPVAQAPGTMP